MKYTVVGDMKVQLQWFHVLFLLRNEWSNSVLKEIGTQNGGKFWTDEKTQTIIASENF